MMVFLLWKLSHVGVFKTILELRDDNKMGESVCYLFVIGWVQVGNYSQSVCDHMVNNSDKPVRIANLFQICSCLHTQKHYIQPKFILTT